MMRLQTYITEASGPYYHVTFKKRLNKIKREGIKPMKKAVNRNMMGGDPRDDPESVYAITDKIEAFKVAFNMNWNKDKKNTVVVIAFRPKGKWEKDTHFQAQFAKGTWVRSRQVINTKSFAGYISEEEVHETIKQLNLAGKLN
jgi:hypothetical protein